MSSHAFVRETIIQFTAYIHILSFFKDFGAKIEAELIDLFGLFEFKTRGKAD
jgi:hypothetical protein